MEIGALKLRSSDLNMLRGRLKEILIEKSLIMAPPDQPFVLSSGKTSTHYINGKKTTSDPEGLFLLAQLILEDARDAKAEAIGGPVIGADPIVGAVAALSHIYESPIPLFLVRKEAKKHGTQSQIEGADVANKRVIVVEDVSTTGASAMVAIQALQDASATIVKVISIVDREQGAQETFAEAGLDYKPIFSISELLPGGQH